MKKIFLFAIAASVALSSFAQRSKTNLHAVTLPASHEVAAKTTATGDTVSYTHISFATDTFVNYVAGTDSGYVMGTDVYGDQGYAERYDIIDTFVSVIGVTAEFTGTVNAASTKSVVFHAWSAGPRVLDANFPSGHVYNSGFPNTSLASVTVPLQHLGISNTSGVPDTAKSYWFPTATAYVPSFFVGYTISYSFPTLNGDTIGLKATKDGERHISYYSTGGGDTTINNINVTQYDDNTWHDNAFDNFQIGDHLFIFPIVKLGLPNGVNGITKNNLTFFGNYPNPATNATNIKFTLVSSSEVTIRISDMAGRTIRTITEKCNAGTQVINVNTESLPAGEYVYLIRTAEGDGFASTMTVTK